MYLVEKTARSIYGKFDNLTQLLNEAKLSNYMQRTGMGFSWSGGACIESADAIAAGRKTPPHIQHDAEELLDKIDASFRDREKETWMPSVAGAYPIVPDYLIGMPECMRARVPVESDIAPLRMFVEVSYSAGVSEKAIAQRGTALAALVMRMSEERPVELHCFAAWKMNRQHNRHVFWSVPLDTAPLSLSQVLNTIACQAFCRTINFSVSDRVQYLAGFGGTDVREPHDWAHNNGDRKENLRKYFGLEKQDIMVERGYLDDESLMQRDPVEWVHRQLEKQRTIEE